MTLTRVMVHKPWRMLGIEHLLRSYLSLLALATIRKRRVMWSKKRLSKSKKQQISQTTSCFTRPAKWLSMRTRWTTETTFWLSVTSLAKCLPSTTTMGGKMKRGRKKKRLGKQPPTNLTSTVSATTSQAHCRRKTKSEIIEIAIWAKILHR